MGDRLRDYGFVNPFRSNQQGSNYNASLSDLSGGAIDQWIVDTATYNKIIRDYGLTSQIEYKQPDGTWGLIPPPKPNANITLRQGSGGGSMNATANNYIYDPSGRTQGQKVETLPEYRWVVLGDVSGANKALQDAGLQGSYTGPKGDKFVTGAYIPAVKTGERIQAFSPTAGGGITQRGGKSVGMFYVNSSDPLGAGVGGSNSAIARSYNGKRAPEYYTAPLSGGSSNFIANNGSGLPIHINVSLNSEMQKVADELFGNPNLAEARYDPEIMRSVVSQSPTIREAIGNYINDTAAYYRSRDDGGGALGVISRGLSGTAQFLSMASMLNAATSFLGSLAGGSTLAGAAGAARAGASAIPSLGGGIASEIFNNPSLSNIISSGLGAIQGAGQGGLPGAALGAISGYVPGLAGSAIGQIGRAAGIGVPPPPPENPGPFQMPNVLPDHNGAMPKFASSGSITQNPTVAWSFRGTDYVEPASSAGTVASTLATQTPSGISPQSAAVSPAALQPVAASPAAPMGAQTPLLSSTGLLSLPANLQQLISASPRGGLLTGGWSRPVMFGGAPVNQQAMMANLPQILANIRSRAGGAPPAAA